MNRMVRFALLIASLLGYPHRIEATADYSTPFFEANRGQTSGEVAFLSRGEGYTLFLTANETVLATRPGGSRVQIKLLGAKPSAQIEGLHKLPGSSNYFIGSNSSQWRTGIPHYRMVRYSNIYRGVDLV